jgi:MFS family permease
MAGVITSSVGAGILVSRTGRYKWILTGALLVMSVGILLFTGLGANTELPVLWLWMFVAGIGIGPTLSVFTIVIQASVPFSRLGVATGNLTFFRQIGGSVGLAVVGTIFADAFASRLAPALGAAGVPSQQAGMVLGFAGGGGSLGQVSDVTLAEQLAQVPPLEGFVDQVVTAVYNAFSAAIADTFWFGLLATFAALVVVAMLLRDLPLRHADAVPVAGSLEEPAEAAAPSAAEA